ncbi:ferrochelatase / FeCH [Leishmania donovani]|uniref:Ferrochelatase-like_protein n=3 Tax=Leishmania donovani species complex TaxID=38574 RepID=A0A6L0XDP9_LEIIN|nr:ferrochelatase-like protein [Leishmania infantum JPCM5]CAC9479146.1 ferrochelatase-like_protein [Leishmania infantum]CAJ1987942.1 ferrochelatase / FeCH [Leishmania donovani]CAM59843.1 ferrochelatase-like protein [Leishmania infantum JPCM5]SUZ40923.1 ferrochelatase-like_protein [Leishmania infantum]VDZ43829.1 ferrochelatase-like_protein/GeneDB:LmjF.17.1460 [Leishmania donovani]|eukprot:XP_001464815.1 ferrochelatase-like protein [Leishmania infantum JPCM5]
MSCAPGPTKAVLLVNLGTTTAPTAPAVRRFLREFLSDRRVIDVPRFLWHSVLYGFILPFRPRSITPLYKAIWIKSDSGVVINGKTEGSPLTLYSESLAAKVQASVEKTSGGAVVARHAMRYGVKNIPSTLKALHDEFATLRELVVLPLFPQYTSTTSASIYDEVFKFYTDTRRRSIPSLRTIRDYAEHPVYVEALGSSLLSSIKAHVTAKAGAAKDWKSALSDQLPEIGIIITYHSIPVRYVEEHDDYPQRCEATTAAIKAYIEAESGVSLSGCLVHVYQSQFGNQPWLGPTLNAAATAFPLPPHDPRKHAFSDAHRNTALLTKQANVCFAMAPGFAVDCVETLNEIEREAGEVFKQSGGREFIYVPCLNDSDTHVKVLTSVVGA